MVRVVAGRTYFVTVQAAQGRAPAKATDEVARAHKQVHADLGLVQTSLVPTGRKLEPIRFDYVRIHSVKPIEPALGSKKIEVWRLSPRALQNKRRKLEAALKKEQKVLIAKTAEIEKREATRKIFDDEEVQNPAPQRLIKVAVAPKRVSNVTPSTIEPRFSPYGKNSSDVQRFDVGTKEDKKATQFAPVDAPRFTPYATPSTVKTEAIAKKIERWDVRREDVGSIEDEETVKSLLEALRKKHRGYFTKVPLSCFCSENLDHSTWYGYFTEQRKWKIELQGQYSDPLTSFMELSRKAGPLQEAYYKLVQAISTLKSRFAQALMAGQGDTCNCGVCTSALKNDCTSFQLKKPIMTGEEKIASKLLTCHPVNELVNNLFKICELESRYYNSNKQKQEEIDRKLTAYRLHYQGMWTPLRFALEL